jgi:hypothetical protein
MILNITHIYNYTVNITLLTLGQIANTLQMPGQPIWMTVVSFLIYIPFAYLGYLTVRVKE